MRVLARMACKLEITQIEQLIASSQILIKSNLSEKRYIHSMNVAEVCAELSRHMKLDTVTSRKIYLGGILHDVAKENHKDSLRQMVARSADVLGIIPAPSEVDEPKLWHAIAGAVYAKETLGIHDAELLHAIRFHTVSRGDMSIVEKIVNIADWISVDRDFTGVEKLRELAFTDLDLSIYHAVKISIAKTMKKNGRIPIFTLSAYNYYCRVG